MAGTARDGRGLGRRWRECQVKGCHLLADVVASLPGSLRDSKGGGVAGPLQSYDARGANGGYAPESITAALAKDSDPERSVFTYFILDNAEDGRQRAALRCRHGRVAQLSQRFQGLRL